MNRLGFAKGKRFAGGNRRSDRRIVPAPATRSGNRTAASFLGRRHNPHHASFVRPSRAILCNATAPVVFPVPRQKSQGRVLMMPFVFRAYFVLGSTTQEADMDSKQAVQYLGDDDGFFAQLRAEIGPHGLWIDNSDLSVNQTVAMILDSRDQASLSSRRFKENRTRATKQTKR